MYKKKDFAKEALKITDVSVWTTKDGKYYVSTADDEFAEWFAYYKSSHGWEEIYSGESFDDCIDQINLHKETYG
jgi:uncharacterized protein YbdZ (MbtH family)